MSYDPHVNGAFSVVAVAPSPATSGTGIILSAGDGTLFPDPAVVGAYNVAVWPNNVTAYTKNNGEIVRFTAKSGDSFSITRAQEGSSARAVVVGDQVAMAPTAKVFTDIENAQGIWLPPDRWKSGLGSPTLTTVGSWAAMFDEWRLHHATVDGLYCNFVWIPTGWNTVRAKIVWRPISASGNVVFDLSYYRTPFDNSVVPTSAGTNVSVTDTAVGGGLITKDFGLFSGSNWSGVGARLTIDRNSASGSDTSLQDLGFIGLLLTPS